MATVNPARAFSSVLSAGDELAGGARRDSEGDAYWHDLALDQIVAAVVARAPEHEIAPCFRTMLHDADAIAYRQEVMRDIDRPRIRAAIDAFAQGMRAVRLRRARADQARAPHEHTRWTLDAARGYVETVRRLGADLAGDDVESRGLSGLRTYLADYLQSPRFTTLAGDSDRVAQALSAVRYTVSLGGRRVTVRRYDGEVDYTAIVEETFDRFRRGPVKDYRLAFPSAPMNHVEAEILDRVARLHPDPFAALSRFAAEHAAFVDAAIARADRELQFYVAYLTHIDPLRRAGLDFCYPDVSGSKAICGTASFDLALAAALLARGGTVVTNDFFLRGPERIFVVSGPNQGGKTTFVRMVGQLQYLAQLGLPVPGRRARLFLCDRLFTHFERREDAATLRGRLLDDLVRMREILEHATSDSLVILNEVFASATARDALALSRRIVAALSRKDLIAVCVTFLTELASLDEKTVSMVGAVDADDPTRRTYRLERRPADGLAYALAIARKYRLTSEDVKARITR